MSCSCFVSPCFTASDGRAQTSNSWQLRRSSPTGCFWRKGEVWLSEPFPEVCQWLWVTPFLFIIIIALLTCFTCIPNVRGSIFIQTKGWKILTLDWLPANNNTFACLLVLDQKISGWEPEHHFFTNEIMQFQGKMHLKRSSSVSSTASPKQSEVNKGGQAKQERDEDAQDCHPYTFHSKPSSVPQG